MKQIAPILSRRWTGADDERFRHDEMKRLEELGNFLARYAEVSENTYLPKTRASQFRHDEYQKLERKLRDVATQAGTSVVVNANWNAGDAFNYHSIERVEKAIHDIYQHLGGRCGRVRWNQLLNIHDIVLYAEGWVGTGPYTYAVEIPTILTGDESIAFIREDATVEERICEYNAVLMPSKTDGSVTMTAYGIKPDKDIVMRVARIRMNMFEKFTVNASAWTGTGPWTATVQTTKNVAGGIALISSDATEAQTREYMSAVIAPSGLSGKTVTLRAIHAKPTMAIPMIVMYSDEIGMEG